jgi:hypothetical protein
MTHFRPFLITIIIIILAGLSIGSAEIKVDKKVNKLFEVNWEAVRYGKSVSRYNTKVSSNRQESSANESLNLTCQVEIKDPNIVLGICQVGVITEMKDGKGQNIDPGQKIPPLKHMSYDAPRYRRRYSQRPQLPKWKSMIRSLLRVRPAPFQPQLINVLQPSRLDMQLDIGLLEPSGGKIKSLKGYFYALTAASLEYVEVPFEPNNTWVRLTDDLEIRVNEARSTSLGSRARYNYNIEERRVGGDRMNRLTPETYLPERMVTGRQFIGIDGKPADHFRGINRLPAHVGGGGSGGGGNTQIDKIRFVIAVNPSHHKIPFELKKIPLPDPELREEKKKDKK